MATAISMEEAAGSNWTGGDPFAPSAKASGPGYPVLAPLASGGFVMLYFDSGLANAGDAGFPLRGRIYSPGGVALGTEFQIPAAKDGNLHSFAAAGLPGGGFVVSYAYGVAARAGEEPGDDLFARIFDARGADVSGEFMVNTSTDSHQYQPSIAVMASGGFVIAWDGPPGNRPPATHGPRAQAFDADGARIGGEFTLAPEIAGYHDSPEIAPLAGGGFVAVWREELGSGPIRAQRFDDAGARVGAPIELVRPDGSGGSIHSPQVAGLADGGFAVVWSDTGVWQSANAGEVRGRAFDAAGAPRGDAFLVNTENGGNQYDAQITALLDGGFAVAWVDASGRGGDASEAGIKGQLFDADGGKVGAEYLINVATSEDQREPALATLAWGGVVTAWGDFGGDTPGNSSTVAARIFSPPGIDARDDALRTDEASVVTGSLFADNGAGGDAAPAAARALVAAVNGSAADVGRTVTLASGALLTLNADGTFRYDPNGAFDALAAAGTGGSNMRKVDSFAYTLAGGDTATARVTVDGLYSEVHVIEGTSGDDVLVGTEMDDVLRGGDGNDDLRGEGGNDYLDGGVGDDRLDGGAGDDYLIAGPGAAGTDVLAGGAGRDTLYVDFGASGSAVHSDGTFATDGSGGASGRIADDAGERAVEFSGIERFEVNGSAFDDYLAGTDNGDQLFGAGGQDTLVGNGGDDALIGSAGSDVLLGGAGADALDGGSGDDFLDGGAGADAMVGGTGGDGYLVDEAGDVVTERANEGTDSVRTALASYRLSANVEVLTGLAATGQALTGNGLDNWIEAGAGNDVLDGGVGADLMSGGSGDDVYLVDNANDRVSEFSTNGGGSSGNGGFDEVRSTVANYAIPQNVERLVYAGAGDATLSGSVGDDALTGGAGDDLFLLGQGGDDTAVGGAGEDGFYFGNALTAADRIDGGAGADDQLALQGDYRRGVTLGAGNLTGIETLVLLPGNDTRFGDTLGNFYNYALQVVDANVAAGQLLTVNMNTLRLGESVAFDGSAETDGEFLFFGGRGSETISGGSGSDGFYFGTGAFGVRDVVIGGFGPDDQLGLQGDYAGANALVLGAGQLIGIESVVLLSGSDARFGAAPGASFSYDLTLGNGNVEQFRFLTVNGNTLGADETLRVDASGEADGTVGLFGGAGADVLIGGAGQDVISGGAGDDRITGGRGPDSLTGGAGNDAFVYLSAGDSVGGASDTISGFAAGDRIDLSAIDANAGEPGEGAFRFVGSAAFGGTAGELRVTGEAGRTQFIEGDTNGDGVADLVIAVTGDHPIGASDFAF